MNVKNLLNIKYEQIHKSLKLILLYFDNKRKLKIIDAPFKPYFFIRERDKDHIPEEWKRKIELEKGNFLTHKKERAIKINVSHPKQVRFIRDVLEANDIPTFEADIPYARRVMIDKNLSIEVPKQVLYWDIEVAALESFPKAEDPSQRIIHIGAIDNNDLPFDLCFDNEYDIFSQFDRLKQNFEVTSGWFSSKFDLPYLIARGTRIGYNFDRFCQLDLDLYMVYRRFFKRKQESYALSAVVKKICQYEIDDWGLEGKVNEMWNLFKYDKQKLIDYTAKQLHALKDIDNKLSLIEMWYTICKYASVLPYSRISLKKEKGMQNDTLPGNSLLIDNLILKRSIERYNEGKERIVFPSKKRVSDTSATYTGGFVKEPEPGIWNYVLDIDATQQYPNIISTFNIGIDTFCNETNSENILAKYGSFEKSRTSMLAEIIQTLAKERAEAKKRRNMFHPTDPQYHIWDMIQFGKKFILNSCYGVAGAQFTRYYNPQIAENITNYAREILTFAERYLMSDFKTLYMDTDSLFLYPTFQFANPSDLIEKTSAKLEELNATLLQEAFERWNVPKERNVLSFKIDILFEKLYLTTKKKSYVGKVIWQNDQFIEPYIFVRGFETVRSSTVNFARKLQSDLFEWILNGNSIDEIIDKKQKIFKRFLKGEFDEQLYMSVGLDKDFHEYLVEPAHVKAAKLMIERNKIVRVGDKIKFVRGSNGRILLPGDQLLYSDRKFIWNNYIEPMFRRLNICKTKQTTLDL